MGVILRYKISGTVRPHIYINAGFQHAWVKNIQLTFEFTVLHFDYLIIMGSQIDIKVCLIFGSATTSNIVGILHKLWHRYSGLSMAAITYNKFNCE